MGSKKRSAASRGTARTGQRSGGSASVPRGQKQSRSARAWKALTHPLVLVILAALLSAIGTNYADNHDHQGAANEAGVQGERVSEASALSADAKLVDFGTGTDPKTGRPQVVIENRSSGWIRNVTLVIPVAVRETTNSDGSVSMSISSFTIHDDGGSGYQGLVGTPDGIFLRDPLPDTGPCELAVTTVLMALHFPYISGATMARSELSFTDPNGIAWIRYGSGELVRNTGFAGPGAWSPYALEEPLPDCTAG